jgi:hypothetical protein
MEIRVPRRLEAPLDMSRLRGEPLRVVGGSLPEGETHGSAVVHSEDSWEPEHIEGRFVARWTAPIVRTSSASLVPIQFATTDASTGELGKPESTRSTTHQNISRNRRALLRSLRRRRNLLSASSSRLFSCNGTMPWPVPIGFDLQWRSYWPPSESPKLLAVGRTRKNVNS